MEYRNIAAEIPNDLAEVFETQRRGRNQIKKGAVEAAIRLWTELPAEIQAKLLDQSMDGSALIELVREIANDQIEAGRKAARALVKGRKRKAPQKD